MESSRGSWHPDPARRHRARWYDGARWTDWVNDGGEAFRDPYGAPATTGAATAGAGTAGSAAGAAATGSAGWFADPTGRYPGRYYDGRRWTEWVSTGGDPLRDPAGAPGTGQRVAGATQPGAAGAAPTTTSATDPRPRPGAAPVATGGAAPASGDVWKQLAAIGPDVVQRPAPSLWSALGGAGGALAAVGLVVVLSGDSDNNAGRAIAGIVLIAVGVLSGLLPTTREVRAAGTAAAAVGIAATAAALAVAVLPSATNLRIAAVPLLFAAAAYVAAWLAPGLRGRPLMIGLGALSALAALAVLIGGTSATALSTVLLLCAGGLLAFVVAADRRGLTGIGTTAIVAALAATWAGTGIASLAAAGEWGLSGDDCFYYGYCEPPSTTPLIFTGLLTFVVGMVVSYVGSSGGRRASTWYGAATSASGLAAVLIAAFEPNGAAASGAVVIVTGGLLIATAALVRRLRPGTEATST